MQKMPFVKAIILGELTDDAEVYRWLSDDLKFKTETNDNFLTGLRGGINISTRQISSQCHTANIKWKQKTGLETSIYTNLYKDTTNQGIWNLLLRWKCSVFRLIWQELVVFLVLYFALSILYR